VFGVAPSVFPPPGNRGAGVLEEEPDWAMGFGAGVEAVSDSEAASSSAEVSKRALLGSSVMEKYELKHYIKQGSPLYHAQPKT
jgi:hypothetical protein